METSTMPLKNLRLTVEEENETSQVLEITPETTQTKDLSEEKDVWLMEEGDDSVFYSDEDLDLKSNAYCDFGANVCKCPGISEAAEEHIPQRDGGPGAEAMDDKENLEMGNEVTPDYILTEQDLQTPKTETINQEAPGDPETEVNRTPEKSVSVCSDFLQTNSVGADINTHPEEKIPEVHIREEEVVPLAQITNVNLCDKLNKGNYRRLNEVENVPEQMGSSELQTSGNRQLELDQKPEQDHNFNTAAGFHHNPTPGHSTQPLLQKSSHTASQHNSFDHLTSSKYSTVSYRKIRRGNTRQKIEEFEYIINL